MTPGIHILCTGEQDSRIVHLHMRALFDSVGLPDQVRSSLSPGRASGVHFQLDPDLREATTPGFDTLGLARSQGWQTEQSDVDLQREILWTLLISPIGHVYPSLDEFDSACRIRFNLVRAAQRTSMNFKTDAVDRPTDFWQYDPDTGFTLRPGKCLIEALIQATQPDQSGRAYAFSCYRATEYVILLALAQEARDHHPALFDRLQRQWQTRAIMSGPFQEVFLRELGSQAQPLPMNWYVPGDRVWFRNPDDASSDVYGYEGSWVVYLGAGRFTNFWQHDQPYDVPTKCLEIYHWRDGVQQHPDGQLLMDEARVKARMDQTLACPVALREVLERMQRLRDPQGVYAHGGCMDATREVTRWVRPGTCDIVLPDA